MRELPTAYSHPVTSQSRHLFPPSILVDIQIIAPTFPSVTKKKKQEILENILDGAARKRARNIYIWPAITKYLRPGHL